MSLRNKLAIMSFTLMSLMTIPMRAENDTTPVTSRIENNEFIVEVTSPEGWQITDKFEAIPPTFEFSGTTFQSLKFENGSVDHGCVVLFSSDSDEIDDEDEDDESVEAVLTATALEAFKAAFPGSTASSFTLTKAKVGGFFEADGITKQAKATSNISVEGTFNTDSGASPAAVNGVVEIDSMSNLAIATGKIEANGGFLYGATGVVLNDDYQLIITAWGADEATLRNDILVFSKSLQITPKGQPVVVEEVSTPVETIVVEITTIVEITPVTIEKTELVADETDVTTEVVPEAETTTVFAEETPVTTEVETTSVETPVSTEIAAAEEIAEEPVTTETEA